MKRVNKIRGLNGEDNPHFGKHLSDEVRQAMSQAAIADGRGIRLAKLGKDKFELNGTFYDSRSEAAIGELMKKYISEYQLVNGETFQASGDTQKIFDFVLPDAIVEWHPINMKYDASKEDYETYKELKEEARTLEERKTLKEMINNYRMELKVDYWMKRQEASDNSEVYQGREVIVASEPNEFYTEVLKRYSDNLPSLKDFKQEFYQLKKQVNRIPRKDLESIMGEAA